MINKTKIGVVVIALFTLSRLLTSGVYAIELVISDNGAGSNNEVQVQSETETSIEQTNEANVDNTVEADVNTGENSSTGNSGETAIDTGDIGVEVDVNNNINGSTVEYECCQEESTAEIVGNGAGSENDIIIVQETQTQISVEQDAVVTNKINGVANTGGNEAIGNGSDVNIQTGNISVNGGIINGPINISIVDGAAGVGGIEANISENGAFSQNNINSTLINESTIITDYSAYIDNNVNWDLNTGGNFARGNNGDVEIITGDIALGFFIENGPINVGGISWDCCGEYDPGDPGDNGDDGNGGDGEDNGDDGSSSDDSGGDDGDGGSLLAEAASTSGPSVIGLSDTSSDAARTLFFWAGLVMVTLGIRFIGSEIKIATSNKESK